MVQQHELMVTALGECRVTSPLVLHNESSADIDHFVPDTRRIRLDIEVGPETTDSDNLSLEKAGPRRMIFFEPTRTTAAIVTCGGLSPGLNNVIRSVFLELTENYGTKRVLGIRNGYLGLNPQAGLAPVELTSDGVDTIDKLGGTVLGSSRGSQDPAVMTDYLAAQQIDILFCMGGDGTQRGAHALHEAIRRRGLPIAVVGIPKTIDNDIPYVRQSFGYATALEKAAEVIRGAHVEARGAINGIGLVKLMGRDAGFIAAGATLISQEVDFTLVPEVAFLLDGEKGFLSALERRMRKSGHAVVVVAEGAGQHLIEADETRRDASGNVLHQDIGQFLKKKIKDHFAERGTKVALKYIDPSYYIRSVPANALDRYLADQMGRHAVHAAMAGKTGMLIGFEHNQFIHVPIPAVVAQTKQIDLSGDLWRAVRHVANRPTW